jgi:hypothetical protein
MASSVPAEWPDARDGWRLLQRRLDPPKRRPRMVWATLGAVAAVLVVVFVLPVTRTAAERLWDQVFVGRIEMVTTDLERGAVASLFSPEVRLQVEMGTVTSLEEAGNAAGFWPRLPGPGIFSSPPKFSLTGVGLAALPLNGPAIRSLAVRAGIPATSVPASWDNGMLEVHFGPVVVADYDGVLLAQSLPFEMKTPADFDLELFYRIAFLSMGMSEQQARAMSADAAISPAYLTLVPKEEQELFTKFTTKTGTGVMIAEVYGRGKIVALWSGVDRLYALYPTKGDITKDFIIKVANSIDN